MMKVTDVAVIALLILQKFGCAITDPTSVGEGWTLSLSISPTKVSSKVKLSKMFMILKQISAL